MAKGITRAREFALNPPCRVIAAVSDTLFCSCRISVVFRPSCLNFDGKRPRNLVRKHLCNEHASDFGGGTLLANHIHATVRKDFSVRKFVPVMALSLLAGGCVSTGGAVPVDADGNPVSLRGKGYATISGQPGRTANQKQIIAIRAAKISAMRDLAEKIYGAQIDAASSSVQGRMQGDYVRANIEGIVRGARTVKIGLIRKDVYEVVLEVDPQDVAAMRLNPRPVYR
jgi:hypothetical protein